MSHYVGPETDPQIDGYPDYSVVQAGDEHLLFESYEQEQQAAYAALPLYPVEVVRRKTHKDLGETDYARFCQETIRFSDGAVRLATRAEPKERYFGQSIVPYPISDGDPLFTGPNGLNEEIIDRTTELGFHVVWLHHQGRHAPWPTSPERLKTAARFLSSKSVGKSACHDHALFDDLERTGVPFSTDEIIRFGFSRSAMSGEAFVALSPRFGRKVVHSDLMAKCFAHFPSPTDLVQTALHQGPQEVIGFGKLLGNLAWRNMHGEDGLVRRYAGTFDLHPMNVAHELAWIPPLLSGDDGKYSHAIPLDTAGVRIFLTKDDMSHYAEHELIHAKHPNLMIVSIEGAHVEGAHQIVVDSRIERSRRVAAFAREHDWDISGLRFDDYWPEKATTARAA